MLKIVKKKTVIPRAQDGPRVPCFVQPYRIYCHRVRNPENIHIQES